MNFSALRGKADIALQRAPSVTSADGLKWLRQIEVGTFFG